MKWAVAVAVATSSLLGCGNSQPSIYRVAVTPQVAPNTCYRVAPTTPNPDTTTNIVDEKQWVIWKGIEEDVYLEPGTINYDMGEARNVTISGDAIRGSKNDDGEYVFTSQRTLILSTAETHTTVATYTIEELGKTLKGTLSLSSACAGADCGGSPTCNTTLSFSGRKLDGDREFLYGTDSDG
ncbi:hypothetical protein [Hyalangium gracile]|uniref:hypothetical protein n=1 Tax=Hyalangium gracile TaxID=394092 RepID=UPI001CCC6C7A|nr:hypothetical protein [Hyalangium gracile]